MSLLVLSYIVSAGLSAAVAILAWRQRQTVGARELAFLMLAIAWWLVASAFEAIVTDLSTKVAWAVIAYPGIESAPLLYLLFVSAWTRLDGWLTPARIALLAVMPVVTVGMAATNESHHLLWPGVTLIDAWGGVTAVYEHGPWFWVQAAYAECLLAVGLVVLVVAIFRYPAVYTPRLRLAVGATLVPVVGSVLYTLGLGTSVHADLSSIAFAVPGIIGAWAILRYRLLDLVPLAWPTLLDALADAVLVLDTEGRLAVLSLSATRLLGVPADRVGQDARRVLRHVPGLVDVLEGAGDRDLEVPMGPGEPPHRAAASAGIEPVAPSDASRWLSIRIAPIADMRGRAAGSLVVLRDVSEHHRIIDTIRALSNTDELTGLLNRRGFMTLGEQQIRTSIRTGNRLWLLFADLDGLKDINDRLGHEAGDRALCEVAGLLRTGSFREADLVARLGGDEFAILAPEISPMGGELFVRRVADGVERANGQPGREFTLSLSLGLAVLDPTQPQSLDELISQADRLMYGAKHARRGAAGPRT